MPKAKVIDLATCAFVERRENVLLVGPTGVGKSHIAQAFGHRPCRGGHTVLHVSAQDLLSQFRAGRGDGSLDRKMLRLASVDLLIINDLGLRPLSYDEPIDLHEIIRQRYQRASTIVDLQRRPFEEWHPLFQDALLASAAMDRLLHGAHVIVIEGLLPEPATVTTPRTPRSRHGRDGRSLKWSAWPP